MRQLILAGLVSAVPLIGGCASSAPITVQSFRSAPASWATLEGKPVSPGSLKVERSHLDLSGNVAYVDGTALGDFSAIADVAFTGGDSRGFAGVFVLEPGSTDRICACVAIRPGGDGRAYRSESPLEPVGGRGWKPLGRASPAGFHRLGIVARWGVVSLTIDGKEIERYSGESAPGWARSPGVWTGLRFGLFSNSVSSRWKNFIAGGTSEGVPFRPEAQADWGDRSDAEANLLDARGAAKSLTARTSRMGIYGTAASIEEAYRAFRQAGDPDRARSALELASRTEASTRESAAGIGESKLHESAFAALAALDSTPAPRAAATAADSRGIDAKVAAARRQLKPLRLDFEVESGARAPIFDPTELWDALRESYGGLERAKGGELRVHAKVERSSADSESVKSERQVPVTARGSQRFASLETELASLEKRLPEDLLDAETRASVLRGASAVLGPETLVVLRRFQLGERSYELHVDDGKPLEASFAKLEALRSEKDRLSSSGTVEYRRIPATLHSSSILVEVSYSVELDGKPLVDVKRERTYLGIEQWTHGADAASGTAASRFSEARVADAVAAVRARVVSRFQTAVSRESLLSKLPPERRIEFLARMARATAGDEDLSNLEWCLKNELRADGATLERAMKTLLE